MTILHDPLRRLALLLRLIALHSLVTGSALIVLPPALMPLFGYGDHPGERFFQVQGGVLHLVMAAVYLLAAARPRRNRDLVLLSIGAKAAALLFLSAYYLLVDPVWVVGLSGLADGAMGLAVYLAWRPVLAARPERGMA